MLHCPRISIIDLLQLNTRRKSLDQLICLSRIFYNKSIQVLAASHFKFRLPRRILLDLDQRSILSPSSSDKIANVFDLLGHLSTILMKLQSFWYRNRKGNPLISHLYMQFYLRILSPIPLSTAIVTLSLTITPFSRNAEREDIVQQRCHYTFFTFHRQQ